MKKRSLATAVVIIIMFSVLFAQSALGATYYLSNGQKVGYNQSTGTYNNYYSINGAKIQPSVSKPASSGNTIIPEEPYKPSKGYVTTGNQKVYYGNTSTQGTNYYPISNNKNAESGQLTTNKPVSKPGQTDAQNSSQGKSGYQITAEERKLIDLINREREMAGLKPLAVDLELSRVARTKSEDMRTNNYFSHTSPTYGSPFQMMKDFGIIYKSAAENIGRTSSVERAHQGFMNSEGHRRNIMASGYTHIGVGISGNYYTELFIRK